MTTPNEELIAALTQTNQFHEDADICTADVIDLLQSQAERIATLEDDVEYLQEDINAMCNAIPSYRWSGGAAELIAECFAERDTLRAELAEIEKAEPVAWRWVWKSKPWDIEGWCYTNTPPNHPELQEIEKLFTRPMPAQGVEDAARYRWLRDYLISPSTHFDDLIVSADKAETLNGVIDAARAKGAN